MLLEERWEAYCTTLGRIDYDTWESLTRHKITGLTVGVLDLNIFPPNTEEIELYNGRITTVLSTIKLPELTSLIIDNCATERLGLAHSIPNLRTLIASNNSFFEINIPNACIEVLHLNNNYLREIHMVPQRRQMKHIDVSDNTHLTALPKINCFVDKVTYRNCTKLIHTKGVVEETNLIL